MYCIYYANDGAGKTGARILLIDYLDENFELQQGQHVLSASSPDTTSFTGLGINRVVVISSGSAGFNNNDITFTASTDLTTQAQIPAQASVTQQCLYHTPINHNLLVEWLFVSPSGESGGFFPSGAKLNIKIYSWSRVTTTRYDVANFYLDTGADSSINITPFTPFPIGGREVLYLTATSDTNNTQVGARFSGELIRNIDA